MSDEHEELAVVTSATFGLDDRALTTMGVTFGLDMLVYTSSAWLTVDDPRLSDALKTWKCTDLKTLRGRSAVVRIKRTGSARS